MLSPLPSSGMLSLLPSDRALPAAARVRSPHRRSARRKRQCLAHTLAFCHAQENERRRPGGRPYTLPQLVPLLLTQPSAITPLPYPLPRLPAPCSPTLAMLARNSHRSVIVALLVSALSVAKAVNCSATSVTDASYADIQNCTRFVGNFVVCAPPLCARGGSVSSCFGGLRVFRASP